jgi:mono/diheme cytochrome c family protein
MTKPAFPKIAAALVMIVAGTVGALVTPAIAQLPEGKGADLVRQACIDCHDLSPILSAGKSRAQWQMVVQTMRDMGANLTGEEIGIVVDYLAASFPPRSK